MKTLIYLILTSLMIGSAMATPAEDEAYLRGPRAATGGDSGQFADADRPDASPTKPAAKDETSILGLLFGVSATGIGIFWFLLLGVLAVLTFLMPWMIFRLHRNIKTQIRIQQSIAQSLTTISQQINHYAAPAPHVPIHKAPSPAQRR